MSTSVFAGVDEIPVGSAPSPEPPPESAPAYTRSARALGTAITTGVLSGLIVGAVHLLNRTATGFREDIREAVEMLPASTGSVVDSMAMTAALALLGTLLISQLMRGRPRVAFVAVLATVCAGAAVLAAAELGVSTRWISGSAWGRVAAAAAAGGGAASTVAMLITGARWARNAALACAAFFLVGGMWADESVIGRLLLVLSGAFVASLAAAIVGTPSHRARAREVYEGLQRAGLRPIHVHPHGGDARGSVPWVVELESGSTVFVKTATSEERNADLLYRLWRRLRLREPGDERPSASLQQAIEHEALAATRAIAAGVRVPRVLALGVLPHGGVFSVHEAVDGESLDDLVESEGSEALSDSALREAWSMVAILHRSRIAHRDLRTANLLLDSHGVIWLVDFAIADLAAGDEVCRRDIVELLSASAALVGPAAAVDAAVSTLGEHALLQALPLVQPLATSAATRTALGKVGFDELRDVVANRTQAPKTELPRLGRLDRRTAISLVVLGVAIAALLPQLSKSGDVWAQIPRADPKQLAVATVFSLLTYVGAAAAIHGAVPRRLPILRSFVAQLASSFVNRVAPARVGGMALNVRWLVREGVQLPVAGAAVSLNAIGGLAMHLALTMFVVLWAGRVGLGAELQMISLRTVSAALAFVAAIIAVSYAVPPLRRALHHRVWPRARQSFDAVGEVMARPRRVVLLLGGSLLVTAASVAALSLSISALGASLPIVAVALVYLGGTAIASAAPTPGGLGATEAALAAGLAAMGLDQGTAIAAVLLYRLVTFWLPIVPGWVCFTYLRRANRV